MLKLYVYFLGYFLSFSFGEFCGLCWVTVSDMLQCYCESQTMSGPLPALASSKLKALHKNFYINWLDHSVIMLQEFQSACRIPVVYVTALFIYAYV